MSREKTNPPEYGTELKLAAVRRVLAGESVRAVAQEFGIRRKRLYVWKDRYAELGEAGRVAQAFDLAGITNTVGCPVLRVLGQGRESEMPVPSGFDHVSATKSNSTRSIAG